MKRLIASEDACCGVQVIDRMLAIAGVSVVQKADDPLDPDGFMRIVAQLRRALNAASSGNEATALRTAINALDVDWRGLSPAGRDRVFEAVGAAIGRASAATVPGVAEAFSVAGPRIAGDTRSSTVRRFALNIPISLTEADRRAIELARRNTTAFVTDALGNRRAEYAQDARDIVARGLEEGIGSSEIAGRLGDRLGAVLGRSDSYWQTVAMAYSNTARTYSQLGAYSQAGIRRYMFEAVLDEVTSDVCRFYHGQVFEVGASLAQVRGQASNANPDSVRDSNPWVREGRNADGARELYIERGGERTTIATIDRSGVGSSDDTGAYSGAMSSAGLQAEGIPYPPLHGRCRSTIVPDV